MHRYRAWEPTRGSHLIVTLREGADPRALQEAAKRLRVKAHLLFSHNRQRLLDEHVIVVAKVTPDDDWYVKDVFKGRWGVKETAARIVTAVEETQPTAWGIERGALMNAVLPYIEGAAREKKLALPRPEPLTHENRIKNERIIWALQGRLEHGKISFRRAAWNKDVEDQLTQFPSTMVHDDIPDALSYIAQLSQGRVVEDFGEVEDYWKPVDEAIGF